jgi:hypothetical protein
LAENSNPNHGIPTATGGDIYILDSNLPLLVSKLKYMPTTFKYKIDHNYTRKEMLKYPLSLFCVEHINFTNFINFGTILIM